MASEDAGADAEEDSSPVRRPRSSRRRGPKPAGSTPGGQDGAHDGGFPVLDADRHLINFREHGLGRGQDYAYFRITRALVVAARRWRKVANERIKATGQTMARWETLFLVAFSGKELTQRQLAGLISVEGPTMVRMLDVLARDGLIERTQSAVDRRVTTNRITPDGTRVIDELMTITNQLRDELLREIDPEKLATASEVLGLILARLDSMR